MIRPRPANGTIGDRPESASDPPRPPPLPPAWGLPLLPGPLLDG
ncbi:MAG: hypothetical protein QOJ03_3005, partial [Frankiaceae bacterium]|nr:hypothetical protein [Frankiaceae bacterium]